MSEPSMQFPEYSIAVHQQGQKKMIFDPVRKKLIPLTPEEWVRQQAIQHLHHKFNLDYSLISVERELKFNGMSKRFDLIASCPGIPFVCLVECKAPQVKINSNTLIQAMSYNRHFGCRWLWLTNGATHYWFELVNEMLMPGSEPDRFY